MADTFATSTLLVLDTRQPEPPPDEICEVLRTLGGAGTQMEDVARRLHTLACVASASALAGASLALASRSFASDALAGATATLATKPGLSALGPSRLLELAVAATKSASLAPVVSAVARVVAVDPCAWPLSDLVRLLLAVAKAKGALNSDDKRELLRRAAVAVTPELGSLPAPDFIKLVLAVAGDGRSELLEAAAEEAVKRISNFPAAQLLILTQGLIQGLGGAHGHVRKLVDFWVESLKDSGVGSGGGMDSDDEVNKRRRELEQRSRLSADQLVQLARVTSPVGSRSIVETIGSQLLLRARELTDAGRKTLEVQLSSEDALGQFSKRDRLRRAVASAGHSQSRSQSRIRRNRSESRSRSRPRRNRSRSSGGDRGRKRRSRS